MRAARGRPAELGGSRQQRLLSAQCSACRRSSAAAHAPRLLACRRAEAPKRNDGTRKRTYKTKEETEKSKTVTSTVVLSLLLIAVVVPMLQYYGYTARD